MAGDASYGYPSSLSRRLKRAIQGRGAGPCGRLLLSGSERQRSLARSFTRSGLVWRSAGRSVAVVGRRAGARLCRGGSPAGPAGPGVTGRRRGASSPGYSAARKEAAAPPSGPEELALPGALTAFLPAPTSTGLTRPGLATPSAAQAGRCPPCPGHRVGASRTPAPSGLRAGARARPGTHGLLGFVVFRG